MCISDLYYLKCLKGKCLPRHISLENLEISDCRHESLPEKGLSASHSVLTIKCCLLPQASCQNNGGKEWHKIAHMNNQQRKKPTMNVHKTCFPISSQVMEMYIAAKDEWEVEEVGRVLAHQFHV
ncbi:unnamed protein product [Lathyrus oleraceus]|uniref:Uncharacterized protein n=1 Tax=Pisum sativum TaxID=3888 RepID=A0A9D4WZS7_PEA|nr:hypothetical protein KIW84_056164 [Pisum sativum]